MLKQLASVVGDFQADEVFEDGTFVGEISESVEQERELAEEVFVYREWPRVAGSMEEIEREKQRKVEKQSEQGELEAEEGGGGGGENGKNEEDEEDTEEGAVLRCVQKHDNRLILEHSNILRH